MDALLLLAALLVPAAGGALGAHLGAAGGPASAAPVRHLAGLGALGGTAAALAFLAAGSSLVGLPPRTLGAVSGRAIAWGIWLGVGVVGATVGALAGAGSARAYRRVGAAE